MKKLKHYKCGCWTGKDPNETSRNAQKRHYMERSYYMMIGWFPVMLGNSGLYLHQFRAHCVLGDIPRIRYLFEICSQRPAGRALLNYGLGYACEYGRLDIVMELIRLGATDWDRGLLGAAAGGNLESLQLMLEYGATNLNRAVGGACQNNQDDIVRLLISEGATKCGHCEHSMAAHPVGYIDDDATIYECICDAPFSKSYCKCRKFPYSYADGVDPQFESE